MKNKLGRVDTNGLFLAQVALGQNQQLKDAKWDDAYGDRVKIRIPSIHPRDGINLKDDDLPWAIVTKPTTSGYMNGQSSGIWGGEWVVAGYINDQLYIFQVLGKNIKIPGIKSPVNGSANCSIVNKHNFGKKPNSGEIIGDKTKPTGPALPSKEDFNNAIK